MSVSGSEKIAVIAELRAKSGHESEMGKMLEPLVEPSRKEPGCIQYNLYESKYYTGDYFTYEEWESEAALEKHLQGAKEKLNKAKALLREDMRITILRQRV